CHPARRSASFLADLAGMCYGQAMDESGQNPPPSVPPPDDFYVQDDLPTEDQPPQHKEDDLDALRIRQIARSRRSAYRSRGYLLIGSAVCAVLALQLIWISIG